MWCPPRLWNHNVSWEFGMGYSRITVFVVYFDVLVVVLCSCSLLNRWESLCLTVVLMFAHQIRALQWVLRPNHEPTGQGFSNLAPIPPSPACPVGLPLLTHLIQIICSSSSSAECVGRRKPLKHAGLGGMRARPENPCKAITKATASVVVLAQITQNKWLSWNHFWQLGPTVQKYHLQPCLCYMESTVVLLSDERTRRRRLLLKSTSFPSVALYKFSRMSCFDFDKLDNETESLNRSSRFLLWASGEDESLSSFFLSFETVSRQNFKKRWTKENTWLPKVLTII